MRYPEYHLLFFQSSSDFRNKHLLWELDKQYGSSNDPEKPPIKEPGDNYISLGALVGMIVGGTPGIILSFLANLLIPALVLYIFGGVVLGGIIGAIVGERIKKRMQKNK